MDTLAELFSADIRRTKIRRRKFGGENSAANIANGDGLGV